MFGAGLIVFRETLEAALFVGIIAASTQGLARRTRWLGLGVALGLLGSGLLAGAMQTLSAWAEGLGQDLASVALLSAALLTLAWHCIWVSAHARERVGDARRMASATTAGQTTLWALALAVALAVVREGAETVLFVSGLMTGETGGAAMLALSVALGLAAGSALGWLIYAGLGQLRPQRLMSITNALVLLLAGGIASQLAKSLNQADLLTAASDAAWDLSAWLPNDSLLGTLLHGLVGYDAHPSVMQLLFYIGAISLILLGSTALKARAAQDGSQMHQAEPQTAP